MQVGLLKGLSAACMVAGNVSMAASIALWAVGRVTRDSVKQNDGLFVGLWVPTFYILSDRLATAALDAEEALAVTAVTGKKLASEDTVAGRQGKGVLPTARDILDDEKNLDQSQTRAGGNVNKSVSIGPL